MDRPEPDYGALSTPILALWIFMVISTLVFPAPCRPAPPNVFIKSTPLIDKLGVVHINILNQTGIPGEPVVSFRRYVVSLCDRLVGYVPYRILVAHLQYGLPQAAVAFRAVAATTGEVQTG